MIDARDIAIILCVVGKHYPRHFGLIISQLMFGMINLICKSNYNDKGAKAWPQISTIFTWNSIMHTDVNNVYVVQYHVHMLTTTMWNTILCTC